ncbi:MAG: hypothetical protein NUW01_06425 [Gemmatimonadaceae bacterium]|nr:hypothetical protein [Gemmatimonadaceae bacterium]
MLLFWRGHGWAVLLILFGWLFLLIGVTIATHGPEGDPSAAANTDRTFALAFALSAVTVYAMAWRKERKLRAAADPVPYDDNFMFIPVKFWAYGFAVIAVFLLVRSFSLLGLSP